MLDRASHKEWACLRSFSPSVAPRRYGRSDSIFMGENEPGGWGAPYNYGARLLYPFGDKGKMTKKRLLYKGEGTPEAMVGDVEGDGKWGIVGPSAQVRYTQSPHCIGWVQMFREKPEEAPFSAYRHEFIDEEKPATATDILWTNVDGDGV